MVTPTYQPAEWGIEREKKKEKKEMKIAQIMLSWSE
jgi:hypothetical protein